MSVVKEYYDDKTKIKIHDDYITEEKEVKEIIISLVINSIKNDSN